MSNQTRRDFLKSLATATSAVVLVPLVSACGGSQTAKTDTLPKDPGPDGQAALAEPMMPPKAKPAAWDPVSFNKTRGAQGAIPTSYMNDINGPDGIPKHLGKHLPYVPTLPAAEGEEHSEARVQLFPAGFIGLMWGDPEKGYAKHPNAPRNESNNNEGHWYNWIKIRKATDEDAQELQSEYTDWPGTADESSGKYAVYGNSGDITSDGGKNTIYLAALPEDVKPGDTIRIWAHCLTHGEYVDFITI